MKGQAMQAFCDFDGTISMLDVSDAVFAQFSLPQWRDVEERWEEGLISARQCMRAQVDLIRASQAEIDDFLDTLAIDEGFFAFQRFCVEHAIAITIVSDGVDHFIRRILANHGITGIDIIANRLMHYHEAGEERFDLAFPHARDTCRPQSGVCKCSVLSAARSTHIYVGDGRSDFCVSHDARFVFAKAKLATYCEEHRIPYVGFTSFHDVTHALRSLTSAEPLQFLPRSRSTTA
ncbi:Haloacid Dehalogenase superfamily, subfamily IB, phosphoserine phosphatase-like/2,3-diketo-5-methylthio-1-phosphopentane phosphatase [Rhizobium sp. RU35A]|nr:Haloacid Dehalogenase superfamily, subfamily IB, phosphoserine phosphatase-like/2,3-diketo-5-methylthio-1-phosphopentane phosphatase [Rhizobium sp. RU35A]